MRKAIVTGASGFIGAHLAQSLTAKGWVVQLLVRPGSKVPTTLAQLEKVEHDGTTDHLVRVLNDAKPDVVFHLASLFLASHTPADIERLISSNVLFSTQLLEAMAEAGVSKLINTGTSWQHFESEDPGKHPVNLYAATKSAFEAILQYYVEARGFSAISLKLFDTYGTGDARPKLIQLLIKTVRSGTPLSMSPGLQQIDLVYIDDVIDAFMLAAERVLKASPSSLESFSVATGKPVSIQELVHVLGKVAGHEPPVSFGGRTYRDREVMIPWAKGHAVPGWQPRVTLEAGLRRLLNASNE